MLIMTNAGAYTAVQAPGDSGRLEVYTYDRESAQTAVDGLEMMHGEVCEIETDNGVHMFQVDREHFAEWVAEEIRQYLTYDVFEAALYESRGEDWLVAHSDIKLALLERTTD